MNDVMNLNDYVSGGYFVTRRIDTPPYSSSDLLPSRIFSASSCICDFIPDTWAIEWSSDTRERRLEDAKKFGLSEPELKKVTKWVTSRFGKEIGWPDVCHSLEVARTIVRDFLSPDMEVVIFGMGLNSRTVDKFLEAAQPPDGDGKGGQVGTSGICDAVQKGRHVEPGGTVLGFEPMVYDLAMSCSWLCNGLEVEAKEKLDISPNDHGFIATSEDAARCVEHISRDDVGAEPGLWLPWLIVEYSK